MMRAAIASYSRASTALKVAKSPPLSRVSFARLQAVRTMGKVRVIHEAFIAAPLDLRKARLLSSA
jgi:hypothetical protein